MIMEGAPLFLIQLVPLVLIITTILILIIKREIIGPIPVVWWKFDEGSGTSLVDSIGSNTGTITNGTWTADTGRGTKPIFASTGRIAIANPLASYEAFTIAMWVKVTDITQLDGSTSQTFIQIATDASNNAKIANDAPNPGQFAVVATYLGTAYPARTTNANLANNTWAHIAWTFNAGTHAFYFNGLPATEGTKTTSGYATNFLAARDTTYGRLTGSIDDVRVYNYVLSDSQIAAIYAEG